MKARLGLLAACLAAVAAGGCKAPAPKAALVETVAVLPFDNESNELNAPDILERLIYLALKPSSYRVLDRSIVKEKLEAAGIKDGGQLAALDPQKLGRDLGVQALLFGNVESFGYTNIGFYTEKKVRLELKLVEVASGSTLWESEGKASTRNLTLSAKEAQANLTSGLISQLADKLSESPLAEESRLAAQRALGTLPGFRFSGYAADEDTDRLKVKRAVRDIAAPRR